MFKLFFLYNGHRIEGRRNPFGKEQIFFDGEEVSTKTSFWGSDHLFVVQEDGEPIKYEIKFNRYTRFKVMRNGVLILETS